MRNTKAQWREWGRWLDQVQAAAEQRKRLAPPLDLSEVTRLSTGHYLGYVRATEKHRRLAEQGRKLLARYLSLNESPPEFVTGRSNKQLHTVVGAG